MKIVTKQEAKDLGQNKYYTGIPCRYGHLDERYVSGDRCLECARRVTKKFKASDKAKEYERLAKYGLASTEYKTLLESQNNKCAICRVSFEVEAPCVDHCHTRGHVRGALCSSCNKMLGFAKDNIATLLEAAEYLKNSGSVVDAVIYPRL